MDLSDFKYNLTALKRCDQYWDEMKPIEGGRLCEKCAKIIVDFSNMTYTEIAFFMAEKTGPVCGYYLPEQLSKRSASKVLPVALGMSTLSIVATPTCAQNPCLTSLYAHVDGIKNVEDSQIKPKEINQKFESLTLKGLVQSFDTATKQTDIVGWATVIVKGTRIAVSANEKGEFELHYPRPLDTDTIKLVISAVALEIKEISITLNTQSEYNLGIITMNKEYGLTEFYVTVKQPWLKRTWRKLTKPFLKKSSEAKL